MSREHGTLLKFEHAGAETDRREVKAVCEAHGDVAFVDHAPGETSGHVRFVGAAAASAALAALTAAPVGLGGGTPSWSPSSQRPRTRTARRCSSDAAAAVAAAAAAAAARRGTRRRRSHGRGGLSAPLRRSRRGRGSRRRQRSDRVARPVAAHVDYRRGEPAGYVRIGTAGAAQPRSPRSATRRPTSAARRRCGPRSRPRRRRRTLSQEKAARGQGQGQGQGRQRQRRQGRRGLDAVPAEAAGARSRREAARSARSC